MYKLLPKENFGKERTPPSSVGLVQEERRLRSKHSSSSCSVGFVKIKGENHQLD